MAFQTLLAVRELVGLAGRDAGLAVEADEVLAGRHALLLVLGDVGAGGALRDAVLPVNGDVVRARGQAGLAVGADVVRARDDAGLRVLRDEGVPGALRDAVAVVRGDVGARRARGHARAVDRDVVPVRTRRGVRDGQDAGAGPKVGLAHGAAHAVARPGDGEGAAGAGLPPKVGHVRTGGLHHLHLVEEAAHGA